MRTTKQLPFSLIALTALAAIMAACTLPGAGGEATGGDTAPTEAAGAPALPAATLGDLSGDVQARPSAADGFSPAQLGTAVNPGGSVKTGDDGRARLDFEDGTTVRVTPLSVFTLTAIETEEGDLLKKIQLEAGKLFIILGGGSLEVDTPSGQASVRGSYMGVSYDPGTGIATMTCLEGTCTLQTDAGEITLGPGESAEVSDIDSPPEEGVMDTEDVQEWLDENPEAVVVVTGLTGVLGDRVWFDLDADGIQDDGEPGVPGATVALFLPDDTLVDTTTTNSEGYYVFVGVAAGEYKIGFDPVETAPFTVMDAGSDDSMDSDAGPDGLTDLFVYDGDSDLTRDAGLLGEGAEAPDEEAIIGPPPPSGPPMGGPEQEDFMPGYNPLTGLPVPDPDNLNLPAVLLSVSNFPVSARPQSGLSFASIIYEIYIGEGSTRFMTVFYGVFPQSYTPTLGDCPIRTAPFTYENVILGNRVWVDADSDGVQDIAELGLPGVCVDLYDAVTGNLLESTTTDLNGLYGFDTLPDNRYFVEVRVPPGFALTMMDAGADDNLDSDFDPATSRSPIIQMTAAHNMSVDAGLLLTEQPHVEPETPADTVAIGDYVWFDMNGNGLQDEGERGVPNVKVILKQSGLGQIAETMTDLSGFYAFTNLDPAQSYSLLFEPPTGFGFTKQDVNNNQNDEEDSDVDGFGQLVIYSHNLGPLLNLHFDAGLVFGGNVHTGDTGGGDGGGGIGPVRSGRQPYKYINWLFPGSCLAYAGKSPEVDIPSCVSVQEGDGDDLNANFLGINLIQQIAKQLNPPLRGLNYSGNKFSYDIPEGCVPVAEWIMYYSSSNRTKWVFDPLSGGWQRFNDIADNSGNFFPSLDRLTGRQLIFANVVVLFAEHKALNAAETIIDISIQPGLFGKALLFRDGMVCDIFWSTLNGEYEQETGQLRPIKFVYADQTPFPMHPGPTWVHIVTLPTCVADGPNAGDCVGQSAASTQGLAPPYIRFFAPTYMP
ncbi:MAG: DUF3048 C-terminal domain-containing protein [Chloroflexi bacterium]|nr:DUF3048 C-terminal domain-containing protein [Chloroflexota bacterium]